MQTRIEVAACFQVKQFAHVFAGVVFERRALNDGYLARFAVARGVAALYASGFNTFLLVFHKFFSYREYARINLSFKYNMGKGFSSSIFGIKSLSLTQNNGYEKKNE